MTLLYGDMPIEDCLAKRGGSPPSIGTPKAVNVYENAVADVHVDVDGFSCNGSQ